MLNVFIDFKRCKKRTKSYIDIDQVPYTTQMERDAYNIFSIHAVFPNSAVS